MIHPASTLGFGLLGSLESPMVMERYYNVARKTGVTGLGIVCRPVEIKVFRRVAVGQRGSLVEPAARKGRNCSYPWRHHDYWRLLRYGPG